MKIKYVLILLMFLMQGSFCATSFFVFVSSSIPKKTLLSLNLEAKKIGGALVLRGLINDSFKETTKFMFDVIEKSAQGMLIDPVLFRNLGIEKAPAFALVEFDDVGEIKKHDLISGNVSLEYSLEQFSKNGELKEAANELLIKLRRARNG